jgi:ABC-2 type transport system permease protein
MAVYKKHYRGYDGPLTQGWTRFLVPARYTFEDLHRSRFLTLFFLASLIWPILCAAFIWLNHNLSALKLLNVRAERLFTIDVLFFQTFLGLQAMAAFFMTAFVGPGLVSPDLANNAVPLYLARPFSRLEYVLSKMSVLVILLSVMTWLPGLGLYGFQGWLEGNGWAGANLHIARAVVIGSMVYILVLSFLALALSAWVKWRMVAGALLFGVFFAAAAFGTVINHTLNTRWGHLINLSYLIGTIWTELFEQRLRRGPGAVFFRVRPSEELPVWAAWAALIAICAFCAWLLNKKVRGVEVVR